MSGTLHLKFSTHDKGIDIFTLERVSMVPVFNKKVISIPLLIEKEYNFVFKGDYCLILAPNHRYTQVRAANDHMFYITIIRKWHRKLTPVAVKIDCNITDNNNVQVNTYTQKTVNINNIHDRFGHVGETLLKKTMRKFGYEIKGTLKSCDACRMAKARAKGVKKHTDTSSNTPGERVYNNLTGPFSPSLGRSKHWMQAADDYTRMGFMYFLKTRDKVKFKLDNLIHQTTYWVIE